MWPSLLRRAFRRVLLRQKQRPGQSRLSSASGDDPIKLGLVSSLARPVANLTGINFFSHEVVSKRLALLHELIPTAVRVAVLVNPRNTEAAEAELKEVRDVAPTLGLQILVLNAGSVDEIDAAFAAIAREHADALLVAADGFLNS